jgi:diguanylate cyclase (GGDEF)-like protein/PAS domain S-box-containing protein
MPARKSREDVSHVSTLSKEQSGTFRTQLLTSPLPTWVYSLETLAFLEVNDAAVAHYGYSRDQFLTMTIKDIRPPEDHERLLASITDAREALQYSGLWRHRRGDGSLIDVEVTSHLLTWYDQPAALVVAHDVTEIHHLHAELARRAHYDDATGLANATLFHDRVATALEQLPSDGTTTAVLVLALDSLEEVESTMGSQVADALVVATADRLRASCTTDHTVARLGRGRFAIMCEAQPEQVVLALARNVVSAMAPLMPIAGHGDVKSVASVGLAFADGETEDAASLVADATSAMRRATERYGDHFLVFNKELRRETRATFQTHQALANATHLEELRLYYQPVVDFTAGTSGCEALLRWDRPGVGLIGPDQFIPLAERSELIVDIGAWVIERAISDVAAWPVSRRPTRVGINLSARQLYDENLVERFTSSCAMSGIALSSVCVELTESAFVATDDYGAYRVLAKLRDLGVEVAIDDFGTGYSSLSYLKHLPFDVVKIDRAFVAGLGVDPTDALLIDAVIRVVHGLGSKVIAEGVETDVQLATLRELGCDAAQGYLLSRPVPSEELPPALERARQMIAPQRHSSAIPKTH